MNGPFSVRVKFREPAPDVFLMAGDGVTIVARQVAVRGLGTRAMFDRIAAALNSQDELIAAVEALVAEVNSRIGNPEISPIPVVVAARAAVAKAKPKDLNA